MVKSSRTRSPRRGAVAVTVAVSLTALLMVAAITLDGGLLYTEKRHAQATADAAALAGGADLYKNYRKNSGYDASGSASASALAIAANNGYANDGTTSTVEVRSYGANFLDGPNAGAPIPRGALEVSVTYNHPRYFSLIMGSGTIAIKARAVAMGTWDIPRFGLLTLDPTGTGLKLGGNGIVNVTTGIIQVNSSDSTAAAVNLNNATIYATEIDLFGGLSGAGTVVTSPVPNNVNYGVPPAADPLASLPVPAEPPPGKITALNPTDVPQMLVDLVAAGKLTQTVADTIKKIDVLEPGTYTSKDKLSWTTADQLVIFKQASAGNNGIYYLKDGGLSSNNASLIMDPSTSGGIMFYNNGTGQNDKISIAGSPSGVVNLSGRTDGTYQGMIIFQNREATQPVSITGNGEFNMLGTFYAPNGELNLTGNAENQTIGSALIAKNVTMGGNGQINVAFSSGMVAPQRNFHLVE